MLKIQIIKTVVLVPLALMLGFVLSLILANSNKISAAGDTYTVCAVGCDFTTLTDAFNTPGIGYDTIQIESGYIFDAAFESTFLGMADGITVECLPGADTIGSSTDPSIFVWVASDVVFQDCTFENVSFDVSGRTDVSFLDNTFSSAAQFQLTFTGANGFTISGNNGIQLIQIQNADNGLIENNTIECRFSSNCINLVTAGGGPFDYTNPADVPSNIIINNNDIVNYNVGTTGDFVYFNAGLDIEFTNNTVYSAVVTDDTYITMVSMENSGIYFAYNYIIFPEKVPGASNGTWGVNIRVSDGDTNLLLEHNTIVVDGTTNMMYGSACLGLYDGGSNPNPVINIEANYNLCVNISETVEVGASGISLSYEIGSVTINLTDFYNGFWRIQEEIIDSNDIITALDPTTVFTDPVLRTENLDVSDDYDPVPMSRHLDVNGTEDIGAYSAERVSEYLIDENCMVDYVTCFSNTTGILNLVASDNDSITLGEGTYLPFRLENGLNNVTIQGQGDSTIIDAAGVGSAVVLENTDNSSVSDIQVKDSFSFVTTTYTITHPMFVFAGNVYDDTGDVGLPAYSTPIVIDTNFCYIDVITEDGYDITLAAGDATNSFNLVLLEVFGLKINFLVPDNLISTEAEMIDFLLNDCEVPASVDLFFEDVFTVSGGDFTYNEAGLAIAGVTLDSGITNPARIDRFDELEESSGVGFFDSSNNTFTNISFSGNSIGVIFGDGSANNSIQDSTIDGLTSQIISSSDSDNNLINSIFDFDSIALEGFGDLNILNSISATVLDSGANGIENATVEIENAIGDLLTSLQTDINGETGNSTPLLVAVLNGAGPFSYLSGGLNPLTFSVVATEYYSLTQSSQISAPYTALQFSLLSIPDEVDEDEDDNDSEEENENNNNETEDGQDDNASTPVNSAQPTNSQQNGTGEQFSDLEQGIDENSNENITLTSLDSLADAIAQTGDLDSSNPSGTGSTLAEAEESNASNILLILLLTAIPVILLALVLNKARLDRLTS